MTGKHVICLNKGKEIEYKGDAVVCALGLRPRRDLLDELRSTLKNVEIIPVGDVNSPRKIMLAVHEGFHAARRV